jgi:hypothetical protein
MDTHREPTSHRRGPTNGHAAAPAVAMPHDVDELLALEPPALEELYRAAEVPSIAALGGDLRGRMLAWPALSGLAAAVLRALARSSRFPWRGKSFRSSSADAGEGVNRVFLDRLKLFRFTTHVGPSRAGDFDAVQLDYDHPGNPFFIRAIKDEIRELRPGLYLGQAYLEIGGRPRLLLYFGLQG